MSDHLVRFALSVFPCRRQHRCTFSTTWLLSCRPADKLSIFLNINRPSVNTNVRVCVKLREADEDYESLEWYEIKPLSELPIMGEDDTLFNEVEFDYDSSTADGLGANDPNRKEFTAFAVRVIFTSTNHKVIPTVRDFRAVASFA